MKRGGRVRERGRKKGVWGKERGAERMREGLNHVGSQCFSDGMETNVWLFSNPPRSSYRNLLFSLSVFHSLSLFHTHSLSFALSRVKLLSEKIGELSSKKRDWGHIWLRTPEIPFALPILNLRTGQHEEGRGESSEGEEGGWYAFCFQPVNPL